MIEDDTNALLDQKMFEFMNSDEVEGYGWLGHTYEGTINDIKIGARLANIK